MEAREATATGESCMRVDAIAKVTGRATIYRRLCYGGRIVTRNMYVALSHMVML